MKLRPVTKLDKRNKALSKKFDDDAMLAMSDVIVNFPVYGQFGAMRNLDSECIACKTYVFVTSNPTKAEN